MKDARKLLLATLLATSAPVIGGCTALIDGQPKLEDALPLCMPPHLRLATDDQLESHALRPDELTGRKGRKWCHGSMMSRSGERTTSELQFLESPSSGGLLLNDVRRHYGRTPSASWTVRSVHLYGAIIVIDDQMMTVTIENGELLLGRMLRTDDRTWYGVYGAYVEEAPGDPGQSRSGWHITEHRYQFIDDPFEVDAGRRGSTRGRCGSAGSSWIDIGSETLASRLHIAALRRRRRIDRRD